MTLTVAILGSLAARQHPGGHPAGLSQPGGAGAHLLRRHAGARRREDDLDAHGKVDSARRPASGALNRQLSIVGASIVRASTSTTIRTSALPLAQVNSLAPLVHGLHAPRHASPRRHAVRPDQHHADLTHCDGFADVARGEAVRRRPTPKCATWQCRIAAPTPPSSWAANMRARHRRAQPTPALQAHATSAPPTSSIPSNATTSSSPSRQRQDRRQGNGPLLEFAVRRVQADARHPHQRSGEVRLPRRCRRPRGLLPDPDEHGAGEWPQAGVCADLSPDRREHARRGRHAARQVAGDQVEADGAGYRSETRDGPVGVCAGVDQRLAQRRPDRRPCSARWRSCSSSGSGA